MDKKTIQKEFRKYVSLSVFEMVCVAIYIIADTFFIALALGAYGLAALNISITSFTVVHSFGLMIGIGGATQYTLIKNRGENADDIFSHSLVVGLVASIIFLAIGVFFSAPIAVILGADYSTLSMITDYMRTILIFSPFIVLRNILLSFIRNDNNPKLAMIGTLVGAGLNIILDYIFLFPLGLGMFGAALATGVSLIISIVVLCLHFRTTDNQLVILRCHILFSRIKDMLSLGTSTLVNELTVAIALIVFNLVILGVEGNIGVAAFGIVMNLAIVLLSIFTGIALGIQPLLSRGHGNQDKNLVKYTMKYAAMVVCILSIVTYIAVYFNAQAIVSLFNSDGDITLAHLAIDGLRIYFIGLIFAGMNVITAAFFSATDNPKTAIIVAILRSCVLIIPVLLVFSRLFGMGGVWASFVATEFAVFVLCAGLVGVRFMMAKRHFE